jgi:hypothetical protein
MKSGGNPNQSKLADVVNVLMDYKMDLSLLTSDLLEFMRSVLVNRASVKIQVALQIVSLVKSRVCKVTHAGSRTNGISKAIYKYNLD